MLGKFGLKTKIMSGAIFPMILIVFLAVTGVMTLNFQSDAILGIDRLKGLTDDANHIEGTVNEMRGAIRGYLLAGNEQILERYGTAENRVFSAIVNLKKKSSDTPNQVKSLERAAEAVKNLANSSSGACHRISPASTKRNHDHSRTCSTVIQRRKRRTA